MELDGLMGLHSDEDTSSNLGEASHCGRHPQGRMAYIRHHNYMTGRATTRGVLKRMRFFSFYNQQHFM